MESIDITRGQGFSNLPGFQRAVDDRVRQLMESGELDDMLLTAMTGAAHVGTQAQPPPPLSREHFDKTDVRQTQLLRYKFPPGSTPSNKAYIWEICIPGSESHGVTEPPSIIMQNGVAIPIATGELTKVDDGPWWTISKLSYPDATASTPITDIYAVVVPNIPSTSTFSWPVDGNNAALKFKRDGSGVNGILNSALASDIAIGVERGLKWHIAGINATTINIRYQFALGRITHSAMMGDGDRNGITSTQAITYSSIVRVSNGVYQIANFAEAPPAGADAGGITNDPTAPMVVRVAGVSRVMKQGVAKNGDADSATTGTPNQRSIHTRDIYGDYEIKNFAASPVAPTTGDAIVGRFTNANGELEVRMLSFPTPDAVDTSPYIELGPHPPDDDATVGSAGATGDAGATYRAKYWNYFIDGYGRTDAVTPKGFKMWHEVLVLNPAATSVPPEYLHYYRVSWHDAAGRLQKVSIETRARWVEAEAL